MASVESNAEAANGWRKEVERQFASEMPGAEIVRLHLNEAGVVQGMNTATLAGIPREAILAGISRSWREIFPAMGGSSDGADGGDSWLVL